MKARKRQRVAETYFEADVQSELTMETQEHLQTKAHLHETIEALQAERLAHQETLHKLQQKQLQVGEMRKKWRETANHLDRVLRQGQAANQMTDDEVIRKVSALRFKVKNFALQFFGDELKEARLGKPTLDFLSEYLQLPHRSLNAYIGSSLFRPMLVRAFLWRSLLREIFGRYCWSQQVAPNLMQGMSALLSESLEAFFWSWDPLSDLL